MNSELTSILKKTDAGLYDTILKAGGSVQINEIRIRRGRHVTLTCCDENIVTDHLADDNLVRRLFGELCQGSVYAHMDTVKNGYIILDNGMRVGVCGRAVTEDGAIKNVFAIDCINIRIPHPVYGISGRIYDKIRENDHFLNLLLFSAPGVGKTTMLRDLAYKLATESNRRIVIIDSRCEITDERLRYCENTDIMYSYPKAEAIEIATRTMSPQYIICDEIGSYDECEALLSVQSAGVPVIATAHASNVIELMRRKNIALLHRYGFFDMYAGIRRSGRNVSVSFCSGSEVDFK